MSAPIVSLTRNLLRRNTVEQALDDELKSSIELLTEERMKEGLSRTEARWRALMELGGEEQVRTKVREVRWGGCSGTSWRTCASHCAPLPNRLATRRRLSFPARRLHHNSAVRAKVSR